MTEAKPTTRMNAAAAAASDPNGRLTNVSRSSSGVAAVALGRQRLTLMNVISADADAGNRTAMNGVA